jgi:hypothetical protein
VSWWQGISAANSDKEIFMTTGKTGNTEARYTDSVWGMALGWAGKNPRSTTHLEISTQDCSDFCWLRITSTARGKLCPTTENKLRWLEEKLAIAGHPKFSVVIYYGEVKAMCDGLGEQGGESK